MPLLAAALLCLSSAALAVEGGAGGFSMTCPDSGMASGKMLSDTCWECVMPIRIGAAMGGDMPGGAAAPVCVCPGSMGYPTMGFTVSMWIPVHIIEMVRRPYCSPSLGKNLKSGSASAYAALRLQGGYGGDEKQGRSDGFYNFHWLTYPIGAMIDAGINGVCGSSSGDFGLLYMSEIDPTWNNSELSLFTTPEAVLFNNPVADLACLADAAAASIKEPLDMLFWCAGGWGSIYPFTGQTFQNSGPPSMQSLTATKAIAAMHRRGLAPLTMGQLAVCGGFPVPTIVKSQYKIQQFHPFPERGRAHKIGAATLLWGEHRNLPNQGEDFTSILFRWTDCCVNP